MSSLTDCLGRRRRAAEPLVHEGHGRDAPRTLPGRGQLHLYLDDWRGGVPAAEQGRVGRGALAARWRAGTSPYYKMKGHLL